MLAHTHLTYFSALTALMEPMESSCCTAPSKLPFLLLAHTDYCKPSYCAMKQTANGKEKLVEYEP